MGTTTVPSSFRNLFAEITSGVTPIRLSAWNPAGGS